MGTSYEYTRHAVATAPRTCGHCRAAMEVTLELVGSSGAIPDYADTLATRERAMQAGLAHDLRRALPLVRCPKCRQRSTLAVRLAIARVAAWLRQPGQVRPVEHALDQVRLAHVGAVESGAAKVDALEEGATELGAAKVAVREVERA